MNDKDINAKIHPMDFFEDADCQVWDSFIERSKLTGTNYHKTQYLRPLLLSFGHKNLSVSVKIDGETVGILPLFLIQSRLFGDYIVSTPGYNYGGIRASKEYEHVVIPALLNYAVSKAKEYRAKYLQLREIEDRSQFINDEEGSSNWTMSAEKANLLLRIPDDLNQLGGSERKKRDKLKSQSKRASKEAVQKNVELSLSFGGAELLNDFYHVFSTHMRDLGTPVYAYSWFSDFVSSVGAIVVVGYWDGVPVSAAILCKHAHSVSIPWASTLRTLTGKGLSGEEYDGFDLNKIAVNTWMYHSILNHCKNELLCQVFDFGRSSKDAGTFFFKTQWGAEPEDCLWYTWSHSPSSNSGTLSPKNKKFSLAIEVWKKMPLWLTNKIGPYIARQLP